ncbi:guanylate cyclase [Tritrichomonas foetus]|uniref:Guanylate cyclase n=1 Tax=Tritrichomonas foetus TaxID=1144522 RepID=A0A1J4K6L2_9EUKA|nr:guanylate cyclase [Tritrichomonas foetus]|eukprot:OHT06528.1 guanylate cyclase [Tritrichomonas foetus]
MNRGEKDISFTVPSSTISFIDVVKFSDYMATLTPKQVMQNLGKYFKNWDDLLQKYKTIIKIKLIGDVYMAAAGLFNPELPPNTHAVEMLSFAIDGVRALDEINHSLEANLSVRIGINTGGPIIAGVLGTDKPLFDIIGDPINLASRLQSTDIANNVQISQSTYDLVKDKNFDIEKRGEIMLKGKGAQMAYLVHPAAQILPMANTQQTGSSFRLPRLGSSYRTINQLPSMKNMQTFPSTLLENHIPEDDDDHNDETSPKAND